MKPDLVELITEKRVMTKTSLARAVRLALNVLRWGLVGGSALILLGVVGYIFWTEPAAALAIMGGVALVLFGLVGIIYLDVWAHANSKDPDEENEL